LSCVSIDDRKAGSLAIDYLFKQGHSKIGIIGGNPKSSHISDERYNGCQMSFEMHGISFDADWFQKSLFHFDSAYQAAKKLLSRHPQLTALFCMSDVMAIGAMRALADLGFRVPEDISVVGFDGIELGQYYNPRLTTIAQPQMELAEISVEMLIGNIEKGRKTSMVTLDVSLKEGESVRKIPE
jgi:LacI family transcriptional regulator